MSKKREILWFGLGTWALSAGKRFTRKRIYIFGWIWTPFVKMWKR